jgi:hypothetical protein
MKTIAFITRVHPSRPNMLKKCEESVLAQTSDDWIHLFNREDDSDDGYGKLKANQALAKMKDIDARYVMVLDDDDYLMDKDFVQIFSTVVVNDPDIVLFRGIVEGLGVLPPDDLWNGRSVPIRGKIASFCFAVRRDLWFKNISEFGKLLSGGDFCFISKCYADAHMCKWLNRIVAKTQMRAGKGVGELRHK